MGFAEIIACYLWGTVREKKYGEKVELGSCIRIERQQCQKIAAAVTGRSERGKRIKRTVGGRNAKLTVEIDTA